MKAKKVKEGIYWVGAIDWTLRNFHGYSTQRGSTYNAFLIIDEKITLIDTVKPNKTEEMMKRIADIIDPSEIDYVVCNHVEMDHSGAIPALMEVATNAEIVTCPNGEKGLRKHFFKDYKYKVVKHGERLNIGKRNLDLYLTPMVHWPDNMVVYVPEEKILFSNDSFGQHYATSARFDDEYPIDIIMLEARKYYANIVLPYAKPVQKEIELAKTLDIEIIAPSHGVIWRKYVKEIFTEYIKWASNKTEKKAVIVYDTMWQSTEKMAFAIQEVFEDKGYIVPVFSLQTNHISDLMTEIIEAEYICVGSPTLNNQILPTVASFLTYLQGLAPKGRKAVAFGSYGWGDQSIRHITEYFKNSNFEIIDTFKIKYIPTEEDLKNIQQTLIEKIK